MVCMVGYLRFLGTGSGERKEAKLLYAVFLCLYFLFVLINLNLKSS